MTTAAPDNEVTQSIPRPHDTIEFMRDPLKPIRRRAPYWTSRTRKMTRRVRRLFRPITRRWDDIWPIIVGIVFGSLVAFGLLLCGLVLWLEWG